MLAALPRDVLSGIVGHLPAREVLRLGCTCRELRDFVETIDDDLGDVGVLVGCTLASFLSWVSSSRKKGFRSVHVQGARYETQEDDEDDTQSLPPVLTRARLHQFPERLKIVELRDIMPRDRCLLSSIFHADVFAHLRELDVLRLGFADGWVHHVLLDGYLTCKTELAVTNATVVYVIHPIVADTLVLGCCVLNVPESTFAVCRHMTLCAATCGPSSLRAMLFMSVPKLRTLCTSLVDVPYLRHMTDLRALELHARDGYVLDPRELPPGLARLRVQVSSGAFGYVPGVGPPPPDTQVVDAAGDVLWRPTSAS